MPKGNPSAPALGEDPVKPNKTRVTTIYKLKSLNAFRSPIIHRYLFPEGGGGIRCPHVPRLGMLASGGTCGAPRRTPGLGDYSGG